MVCDCDSNAVYCKMWLAAKCCAMKCGGPMWCSVERGDYAIWKELWWCDVQCGCVVMWNTIQKWCQIW